MSSRRVFWSLWAVVLLGVLIRAAAMLRGPAAFDDPDNYLPLARSVAGRRWFHLERAADGVSAAALSRFFLLPRSRFWVTTLPGASPCFTSDLGAGTVWMTAAAAKGSGFSPLRSLTGGPGDRLRPGTGLAKPLGDDRNTHGLLSGRGSGRTDVPGMAGTGPGRSRPGPGRTLPAQHARGGRADCRRRPFWSNPANHVDDSFAPACSVRRSSSFFRPG